MFPFDKNFINELTADNTAALAELDSNGLIPAPRESFENFKNRIANISEEIENFEKELAEKKEIHFMGLVRLKSNEGINSEIMEEAAGKTDCVYGFSIKWVPGFFLSKGLGILWGGCAISFHDSSFTIFLIRANFAKRKRWLFYKRDELLSHELCHIARMPLRDRSYEEMFAYHISPSRFRRYLGNCFQTQYDAVFFLLPIFLLFSAQIAVTLDLLNLPMFLFWILAAVYPLFLLVRNQLNRNILFKAEKTLISIGISKPLAILFRCNSKEISEIASLKNNPDTFHKWSEEKSGTDLRWKIIRYRFL